MNLDNFKEAFRSGTSGCIRVCHCETTYYNSGDQWTFEDGELEKLQNDRSAIELDNGVYTVFFDGKEFITDCDCWHERAEHIMEYFDSYMNQIAEYFKLEKKRIQREANQIPDIQGV
ncbi:hypothetical protein KAR91_69810 [Candidatus Pacearchaeota archaeon]|nr:hypothetical protein [Candidatus Pacearchaeota archaeon]